MPTKPYNQLGQIIRTGGVGTTAVRMYQGMTPTGAIAKLTHKYGEIDKPTSDAILDLSNRGLVAGTVLTLRQTAYLAVSGISAEFSRDKTLPYSSRFTADSALAAILNAQRNDAAIAAARDIPFGVMPVLTDLFGDNTERYRAFVVTHQPARRGGLSARLDVKLAGDETWDEFVGRAIAWRDYIADYDPYRFDDMSEEEIVALSIRIVAGWRAF
jgi:hypothetical protein